MSEPSRSPAGLPPRWARAIDRLNEAVGAAVGWLALLMVLVGAYNALARWAGRFVGLDLASNAYLELQWYLFSALFLLAAAYALARDAHVRVDVLYGRLGRQGRAWIDLVGSIVFLLPFCAFGLIVAWPSVRNSWAVREGSPDPGGLPRYPVKTLILVAFALLLLQGLAEVARARARLSAPDRDGEGPTGRQAGGGMA